MNNDPRRATESVQIAPPIAETFVAEAEAPANRKPGQRKRYLAIDNKYMYREARVVDGFIRVAKAWQPVPAGGLEVAKDTLVKSGSHFEIVCPRMREREWFEGGTVAPGDALRHFNMEDVFEPDAIARLALYGIHTLEDVAMELDALIPGSEFNNPEAQQTVKPLRELLGEFYPEDPDAAQNRIAEAKRIVQADAVKSVSSP